MLKLVTSEAFHKDSDPAVTIVNFGASYGFEKAAAHEEVTEYLSKLTPKPGYTYLHINAMTAGEFHGSNRNGDFFPEENLKQCYKTFETTPAYVYRSHINKDPAKSYGKVIFAIYNERMHRVELICECPEGLVGDVTSRIREGDFPTTSMATKTPFDTCSICGNKARSRQEYCQHLTKELNKLYPDGRRVMAVNNGPLTFFDISIVVRPADVNSSILQKVAEEGGDVIGSAELAEIEGLSENGEGLSKKAAFRKFADLIKEIDDGCYVVGAGKNLDEILGAGAPKELPLDLVEKLHSFDISQVLLAFANLGISPSINFLAELIARKHLGEGWGGIGILIEDLVHKIPESHIVPVVEFNEAAVEHPAVAAVVGKYVLGSSLDTAAIEKRASNVGFNNNGPFIEPTVEEEHMIHMSATEALKKPDTSLTKFLIGLAAGALLAKLFITKKIEHRVIPIKINIRATPQLAKMAMFWTVHSKPKSEEQNSHLGHKAGLAVTKQVISSTNSKIGGKLLGLIRVVSAGSKATTSIDV